MYTPCTPVRVCVTIQYSLGYSTRSRQGFWEKYSDEDNEKYAKELQKNGPKTNQGVAQHERRQHDTTRAAARSHYKTT